MITQTVAMVVRGSFDSAALGSRIVTTLVLTLLPTAIPLPLVYRFGAERGQLVYYIIMGVFAGFIGMAESINIDILGLLRSEFAGIISILAVAGIFALSWWISVQVFRKREW